MSEREALELVRGLLTEAPGRPAKSTTRRLVAAGVIRRTPEQTLTVRVTQAGVTGSIRKAGAR
ncbi:hypothetical protein [Streptomyces canus]|uniref:hypothetical protein n=1 Tax=Streptomyces canus TaxID=58343 RepID=UPI00036F6094|nr:hypothetical protein [Streptomyces canus]